jgi:hypothetical protein
MKLYAGTTEQFRAEARMHRIAEKLRAEYTAQIGHRPAPSEVAGWQNSLMALSMLVDQAELNHRVTRNTLRLQRAAWPRDPR